MRKTLVSIVEGHGEVDAVPILVRRIAAEALPELVLHCERPIRAKRNEVTSEVGFERTLELAARQVSGPGGVLILVDADDDCPVSLAAGLRSLAARKRPDRRVAVVVANMEYEAWFLAAISSLAGHRGLPHGIQPPPDPEHIRDAKGWISRRLQNGREYRPTIDQPAFSALMSLQLARSAKSFDKFYRDVAALLQE